VIGLRIGQVDNKILLVFVNLFFELFILFLEETLIWTDQQALEISNSILEGRHSRNNSYNDHLNK
jgi:hypothetical protein